MTFLNNNTTATATTTTVLPDFQYLTSPSGEKLLSTRTTTPNYIPIYPIPKSVDVNQYGNNITNNTNLHSNATHVNKSILVKVSEKKDCFISGNTNFTCIDEQFYRSTTTHKYGSYYDWLE